jgi:hypothetical protein
LVTLETFPTEVKSEGYDSALLLFSSSTKDRTQEAFVRQFIDCKTRFKKMRHRGIRFHAVDVNQAHAINYGVSSAVLPMLLIYPGYHKSTAVHRYSGNIDSINMAKFLHKKADVKFEWNEKYFRPPVDRMEGAVMMDVDENGNVKPDPEKIAELQAKQDREEREKQTYMRYLEENMNREDL